MWMGGHLIEESSKFLERYTPAKWSGVEDCGK